MLNPDGGMFFCENSEVVGNVRDQDPGEIYFSDTSQGAPRPHQERRVPDVSQPVSDERRGDQAGRALRRSFSPRASREKRKYRRVTAAAQSATRA